MSYDASLVLDRLQVFIVHFVVHNVVSAKKARYEDRSWTHSFVRQSNFRLLVDIQSNCDGGTRNWLSSIHGFLTRAISCFGACIAASLYMDLYISCRSGKF